MNGSFQPGFRLIPNWKQPLPSDSFHIGKDWESELQERRDIVSRLIFPEIPRALADHHRSVDAGGNLRSERSALSAKNGRYRSIDFP